MSAEDLTALTSWGTFLSGLGTLIIAFVGGAILAYDVRLRRRQLRETRSRSYATLNVEFHVSVHKKLARSSENPEWILEARIILTNASTEIFAVPAVYVHARALPEANDYSGNSARTFSEADFSRLEPVDQLSEPKNVAYFPSSIWHLGPGEIDSVVRWDVLSEEFIQRYPAVIVWAEIYSVPNEFLGAAYSPDITSETRCEWTDFMESEDRVRHRKVIFSHARKNADGVKKGDWALLEPGNDDIDIEASKRFRKVLANLCKTGRQTLIVLNSDKKAEERPEKRPTQSLKRTDTALARDPAA